jgi:hypothetical protein
VRAAYFNLKIILAKEGLGNFPNIEKSLTRFEVSSIQKNWFARADHMLARVK